MISNSNSLSSNMLSLPKFAPTRAPAQRAPKSVKIGSLTIPNVAVGTINWGADSPQVESYERVPGARGQFYDTAERYSTSPLVGLGMGWGTTEMQFDDKIGSAIVGTKFTPTPWRKKSSDVVEAALRSCERLGVEQLDLYSIHTPDIFSKKGEELNCVYWDGLVECVERGIVKNVGVSNYGSTLLTEAHAYLKKKNVKLVSNQIHYSLLYNDKSEKTKLTGEKLNIKTFGYFGLGMGLLTGSYSKYYIMKHLKDYGLSAADGYNIGEVDATMPTRKKNGSKNGRSIFEMNDLTKYAATSNIDALVGEMVKVAVKHKKTVAQVAINYCVTKGVVPIVGVSSINQFKSNLDAGGSWRLDAEDMKRLESVEVAKFEGAGFKRSEGKFVGYGEKSWSLD